MIVLKGKYNSAKVFTNNIDEATREQIVTLCDQDFTTEGSNPYQYERRINPCCWQRQS